MKTMDNDGLLLCKMQGEIFEKSITLENCSSSVFIRRYMNSKICMSLDELYFLNQTTSTEQVFEEISEEYGKSTYGTIVFSNEEMYWIGYIYRYLCYTYQINSKKAYKLIKPTELKNVYYPYHTLDPMQAIDRILESKEIFLPRNREERIQQGVMILREIRKKYNS